jgi:hypothetical protein
LWQKGCRDPRELEENDVHIGISLFPASVPFTTCGKPLPLIQSFRNSTFGTEELRECTLPWKAIHLGKIGMLTKA